MRRRDVLKGALTGAMALAASGAVAGIAAPLARAVPSVPGSTNLPDGDIWVPNYGTGSIFRLDGQTMDVVAELEHTGDHPMVAKMNADGSRLFVGNFGPFDFSVTVVDTETNAIIKKIPTILPAFATITMSVDRERLYVPTAASTIQVVNTRTLETERVILAYLPPVIAHIEVSPDERWIYVFNAAGPVTRYDAVTGQPAGDILLPVGSAPGWGALSSDGKRLYTVSFFSGVSLIDTEEWRVVENHTINPFGAGPISGTLTPDETEIWVCNYTNDSVYILDAFTLAEKRRFDTNGAAVYMSFADDGRAAWITTVDDGPLLPVVVPIVSQLVYRAKHVAWFADLLGLKTRVTLYDTATLKPHQEFETRGAFVAGVFPPAAPDPFPAEIPERWSGRTETPLDAPAEVITGSIGDSLGSLNGSTGSTIPTGLFGSAAPGSKFDLPR